MFASGDLFTDRDVDGILRELGYISGTPEYIQVMNTYFPRADVEGMRFEDGKCPPADALPPIAPPYVEQDNEPRQRDGYPGHETWGGGWHNPAMSE